MEISIAAALRRAARPAVHRTARTRHPILPMLSPRTRWIAPLLLACGMAVAAQAAELDEARDRLARGDTAGALQRLEQGLAREPGNAQLRFLQGVTLMDLGRDVQALEVFRQLHQAYPELPEPLNNIGLLQARAGQLDSARQSLQDALRADPQHRAARANLGQVYLMLAVQAWELATAGLPDAAVLRRLEGARALLALPAR
jgi:Flp pilus assembly protein TadD